MKNLSYLVRSGRRKGIFALVVLTFSWASLGFFARYFKATFLPFQQVYLVIFVSFLVGLIVFRKEIRFSKFKRMPKKELFVVIIRALATYFLGAVLFRQAYIYGKYGSVAFIQSLPFTAILGFLLLREKISSKKIILVIIAFLGAILISINDFSNIFVFGKGELLSLISSFFFSLSYIARRWHTGYLNNAEMTELMIFFGVVFTFVISLLVGEGLPFNNWTLAIALAVFIAGLLNVVNLFLVNYGFSKIEMALASNILTLEGVFGFLFGFILYRELLGFKEVAGAILILIGVVKMNKLEEGKI